MLLLYHVHTHIYAPGILIATSVPPYSEWIAVWRQSGNGRASLRTIKHNKNIKLMLHMGKETIQSPQEVLAKAATYFGPGGTGLNMILQGPNTLGFTGGGGFVLVQADPKEEEEGAKIDIQSREWDYHVKRFLSQM